VDGWINGVGRAPAGLVLDERLANAVIQVDANLATIWVDYWFFAGERWFRPEFGIGVRALIFEPNNQSLADITSKRLTAALIDALKGEVVPQSLDVSVEPAGEKLVITIAYTLAAINHTEKLRFAEGGAL
jgi:hypothetical protein